MTEILWGPYLEHHITVRHGVTAEQFEEAWVDRVDLVVRPDDPYESLGATNDGQELYLVWRWDMTVPIRYTTEDTRSAEQAKADDQIREDVEQTGGVWARMTVEQRAQLLARLRDKKQRAQAARDRKKGEQEDLEDRVTRLEERVARLEG